MASLLKNCVCVRQVQRRLLCSGGAEFNTKMLEYLVCPLTKEPLEYDQKRNVLLSRSIEVAYPVVNGVPIMDPSRALRIKELSEAANQETVQRK